MPRRPILPDAQVVEALHKNAGNVAQAAAALGLERTALHRRISKSPVLQEAKRDGGEMVKDMAESVLFWHLREKNLTAAMFVLNNHPAAKAAGWGPRTEVTGAEGGEIVLKVVYGASQRVDDSAS